MNSGDITYNIYLRANALYNFAVKEENQKKFNLLPFVNPDVLDSTGEPERGGSYAATYTTFEDTFTLDRINRNGWYMVDEFPAYYINNVPVTGLHKVPGYEDPQNQYIYYFNEDGTKDYGVSTFGSTFPRRINAFLEDVTNKVPHEYIRASGRDALATLEYTFAAIKSYENGGELVVPEMLPPIRGDISFIK